MRKCAICEGQVSSSYWFCKKCYKIYFDDIKGKSSWIKFLTNCEQKQRRDTKRDNVSSLDNFDIDTEGNILVKGK